MCLPRGWPKAFRDGDGVKFASPMTIEGAHWWHRHFPSEKGYYPRDFVADLTKGAAGHVIATFEELDPEAETFTLGFGLDQHQNAMTAARARAEA